MDKDFCLTKWNDEEKKTPNVSDFIQKIEKATKTRKANKSRFWLQYAKQARLDQINRVKFANDVNCDIEEPVDAGLTVEEDGPKKEKDSKS